MNEVLYMVQDKISGKNGELCNSDEKKKIWRDLGRYAKKYHQVQRIEDKRVEDAEFHKDWKARLEYNLNELNSEDALLNNNILNQEEHRKAKTFLSKLKSRTFQVGLVHGDLCPRNVILNKDNVYLLDWGMADINVIPHNELGIVLMSKEASQDEFQAFKEGYGISNSDFLAMEEDIRLLNFLHTLDKYRWAKDFAVENIEEYEENIKDTFNKLNAADNK